MAVAAPPENAFPLQVLVPKRETGADSFLSKYPDYDGRGVVVAILDTGVDPGAPGLQVTSTGERKVIDCIDASGSGDVNTSHTVTTAPTPLADDGSGPLEIAGVSRRTLKLNGDWKNPTGVWHVGARLLEQIFPKVVNSRVKSREDENEFQKVHAQAVAKAMSDLEKFKTAHPSPSQEEKGEQEELQACVDVLSAAAKKLSMPSPLADVVAFHDGDEWSVAISVSEDGDMTSVEAMLPFRVSGKFATFGGDAMVNYTVDVFDDGDTVSICIPSGSHGTHVAGITAACFPDEPARNGVAPGAQIINIKIGDSRLGTMETGTAFIRAANACIKYKCDVVNLSYGEAAHINNSGYVVNALAALSKKHGITFVSSAGNNGPCLSTVGCPGGSTSTMIGVGAYVSPEMREAQYSLLRKCPGQNYTWSSAGPSTDGNLGVDISAPGGAITSVPTYTLKGNQLMNGTSMSSPNACGCVALILSGLKDNGVPYSPFSIRRALINTAKSVPHSEPFVLGHGLVQVEAAYNWLSSFHDAPERQLWFDVSVSLPHRPVQRGVYLRDGCESLAQPVQVTVTVTPRYPMEHADFAQSQLDLDLRLSLVSTESWVTPCSHLALANASRTIPLSVDTRGLPAGHHYAEVQAFDSANVKRGPLFRIPVTVLVPKRLPEGVFTYTEKLAFNSGEPQRRFFQVPDAATFYDVSVRNCCKNNGRYTLHAIQLEHNAAYNTHELDKTLSFSCGENEETLHSHSALGGAMLELTLTKWWASSDVPGDVEITLTFKSLQNISSASSLLNNTGFQKVLVRNGLGPCYMQPQCSMTHMTYAVMPSDRSTVMPLGERDCDDTGVCQYQLQLTYKLNVPKSHDISPQFRWLSGMLYESDVHGQIWLMYDANKRFVTSGDAFADRYSCKLEKGDYTVKLQVRHHSVQTLEGFKDLPMTVVTKLASPVALDIYESQLDLMQSRHKTTGKHMPTGLIVPLFIKGTNSAVEKLLTSLPKALTSGLVLEGHLSFSKPKSPPSGTGKPTEPDRQPFSVTILASSSSSKASSSSPSSPSSSSPTAAAAKAAPTVTPSPDNKTDGGKADDSKSEEEESNATSTKYQEALRDFNISFITKHGDLSQFSSLAEAYPDHLPLFVAHLTALYNKMESNGVAGAVEVVQAAAKVISMVDVKEMASVLFRKKDNRSDADTLKSGAEKGRAALQDALIKQGLALSKLVNCDKVSSSGSTEADSDEKTAVDSLIESLGGDGDPAKFKTCLVAAWDSAIDTLETWFDLWDKSVLCLSMVNQYYHAKGQNGRAAKAVLKLLDSSTTGMKEEEALCKLLDALDYGHLSAVRRRALHTKYPEDYLPF